MSEHWNTPQWIVDKSRAAHGVWMDLDPFSNEHSVTNTHTHWFGPGPGELDIDGFEHSWAAVARTVFFNPPWKKSGLAVRKAQAEHEDGCEIIGLIPCSMNSRHWPLVEAAPARCYLHKRPSFTLNGEPQKGNPKDVALIYWGPRPYRFADIFSTVGRIHFGVIG